MANLYDLAGANANVDPILLQAIARTESGENDNIADSKAGAGGRMQFMPATAAEYGVDNVRDPNQSIPAAARKMNDLLTQHGDVVSALKGYNAGNPNRWNNPETQAYPGKVNMHYQDIVKERQLAAQQPAFDDSDIFARPQKGVNPPAAFDDSDVFARPQKGVTPKPTVPPTAIDAVAGKPIDESRVPGIGTQAKTGLATDQDQQRRIMAGQIFPNIPLDEAMGRIGFAPDGRMIAVDGQNNPFYVDPKDFKIAPANPTEVDKAVSGPSKYSPAGTMASALKIGANRLMDTKWSDLTPGFVARGAGSALPMAGGIAGGMLATPTSLIGGPIGAAGGAAIGDALRQKLAGYVDPGTQPYNLEQTGREALLSGAGQLAGGVVARTLAPNPLLASGADISVIRKGSILPNAETAYQRASAQGIDLTPGQATGLPSLRGHEDSALQNPAFADLVDAFYKKQGIQTQGAANNLLSTISPTADKNVATASFQKGAGPAVSGVRTAANDLATSQFDQAHAVGQAISPELTELMQTPAVRDAMDKARNIYRNKYGEFPEASGPVGPPDALGNPGAKPQERPDFNLWKETKQVLDDDYKAALRNSDSSAGRSVADGIDSVRKRFIAALDDAYPSYGPARAIAAPGHAEAAALQDAALGKVAKAGTDQQARPILSGVFERSNPAAVTAAREAYVKSGQEAAWNDGIRAYLQDAIDKASTSAEGLNPSMLHRNVWGKPDIRANMQAAMTPDQFKGFNNFVDTLEDLGKTYPANSATDRRAAFRGALDAAAENTPGNKLMDVAGQIGSPAAYWRGLPTILDPIKEWNKGRNIKQVIGNLFAPPGPDGVAALDMMTKMANIPPKSRNATSAALQILSRTAPSLPADNAATSQSVPRLGNRLLPTQP